MIQRKRRRNKVTVSTKTPKTHAVPNGRSATSMSAATVVSKYQTFPQGDCAADFPPDDIVYEVSVQELKQLRRKIDDLPYPIVVQLGNIFNNPGRQWTGTEATMRSRAAGASKIEMLGGVPVDRALDPKVRDLLAPAFVDVAVSNVDVLSRTPGAANVRVAGKSLRVALNATAREELAA